MDKMTLLIFSLQSWLHESQVAAPYVPQEFPNFPDFCRFVFESEESSKAATEAAVVELLNTGAVPKGLASWPAYFLRQRISCALDYVGQISCTDPDEHFVVHLNSEMDRGTICEVLLLRLWDEYRRDHWLKALAVSYYFQIPFFGVKPAT
jgi:hypothetical protein